MAGMESEYSGVELLTPRYQQNPWAPKHHQDRGVASKRSPTKKPHSLLAGHQNAEDGFVDLRDQSFFAEAHPQDRLFHLADKVVHTFNVRDISHHAVSLQLRATTTAATCAHETSYHAYYMLVRQNKVAWVHLRAPSKSSVAPCDGTVEVQSGEDWCDFALWLEDLPITYPSTVLGKEGFELQYNWWMDNGKHFRLLELPQELLDIVILHSLGEHVHCVSTKTWGMPGQRSRKTFLGCVAVSRANPEFESLEKEMFPDLAWTNKSMFYLNNRTRLVALSVLAADTVKFMSCATLLSGLLSEAPSNALHNIRRLRLSFTYEQYMRFFKVNVPFHELKPDHPTADLLTTLPNLRCLQLYFCSSVEPWQSPWWISD